MLKKIFKNLDFWIEKENHKRMDEGRVALNPCQVKVLGQMALLEARLEIDLAATVDVDVYENMESAVRKKFVQLLEKDGKFLDPDSHLIWMPSETQYASFYSGRFVKAQLAQVEYVLISKALKAPEKNQDLIRSYLALMPSERFLELARKYTVDLEQFL